MGRREDLRLITGQGRYTVDWKLPKQLHAVFLRSDRAHAEIIRLDATRALAMPGVVCVLAGEDAKQAGFKSMFKVVGYPGQGGQSMRKPFYPILAPFLFE
jgi:carbon-monoxide dehydrogenase large subunit